MSGKRSTIDIRLAAISSNSLHESAPPKPPVWANKMPGGDEDLQGLVCMDCPGSGIEFRGFIRG
jgi:hypothetical protein